MITKGNKFRTLFFSVALLCSTAPFFTCENMSNGGGNENSIQVKSVKVEPETASVQPGLTRQFAASVEGEGEDLPDQAVTWSIAGDSPAGATIDAKGFLALPESAEPGATFTIRATSLADTSKHGSAGVTVVAPPPVEIPVKRVVVNPETASVQPGQTQRFSAIVEGEGETLPDQRVDWSIAGENPAGAAIDAQGLLTVPADAEPGATFTVIATSSADNSKHGSAVVTVAAPPPPTIPVRRVLVSPRTVSVQQGLTQQFAAQVEGYDNAVPDQRVIWSILETRHENTVIDENGLLTISGEEEKDAILTVRATSSTDTTKYGSATVTVTAAPAIESIEVMPAVAMAAKRLPCQFAVIVTASGDIAKTVLWTIEGEHKPGTSISETGYLTIADDEEPGVVFTVKATSTAAPGKFGTSKVTIVSMADPPSTLVNTRWGWESPWGTRIITFDTDSHAIFDNYSYIPETGGAIYDDYYTYDPETGTGTIWGGYPAGDFILINDNQTMSFSNYKNYGHGATFDRMADLGGE